MLAHSRQRGSDGTGNGSRVLCCDAKQGHSILDDRLHTQLLVASTEVLVVLLQPSYGGFQVELWYSRPSHTVS